MTPLLLPLTMLKDLWRKCAYLLETTNRYCWLVKQVQVRQQLFNKYPKCYIKKLTVINVSQQTETSDLLGGYKPVNCRTLIVPIVEEFEELFPITFSMSKNEKFYSLFHKCQKATLA